MGDIKAIETYYNGYRFRSRLEAEWAVFFDSIGVKWIYEPEGLHIGNLLYLPDFYLPECKQFFEVKGIMSDLDLNKIKSLINAGHSVTIGYDNGAFTACDYWGEDDKGNGIFTLCKGSDSMLCRCKTCGKYWFMGSDGAWSCQNCGEYDGDSHFVNVMDYHNYTDVHGKHYEGGDTSLWDVARKARFEHGETPKI